MGFGGLGVSQKNRWPWQVKLEKRGPVAWGRNFGRLEPKPGTETYGRHSFNIHGGTSKGSAGCIDMGNNEKEFFEELRRDFAKEGEATVIVDYSGASSKACECTEVSPAGWKNNEILYWDQFMVINLHFGK